MRMHGRGRSATRHKLVSEGLYKNKIEITLLIFFSSHIEVQRKLHLQVKMSRITALRVPRFGVDKTGFDYPFSELEPEAHEYSNYALSDILKTATTYTGGVAIPTAVEIGDFPKNIAVWLWASVGELGGKPWILLCRLTNGLFAHYVGSCDTSGFYCSGHMSLSVSTTLAGMIDGLDAATYARYIEETAELDMDTSGWVLDLGKMSPVMFVRGQIRHRVLPALNCSD